MINVLEGFSIIALILLLGYSIGRSGLLGKEGPVVLNKFAFYIAMPALMFKVLSTADLHIVFSSRLAIAGISFLAVALIYAALIQALKKPGLGRLALGATATGMNNANNMGLPVAIYVLGDATHIAPILLFQLAILSPVLLTILDLSTRGKTSLKDILLQPIRNPLILGSLLGIGVNALSLPVPLPLAEAAGILGGAGVPLMLTVFGMNLAGSRPLTDKDLRLETLLAALFKMTLLPLAAYLLARYTFNLSPEEVFAATLLACLPTAQNAYNYAFRYGVATVLIRDVVLITTLLSLPAMLLTTALLGP